MKTVNVAALKQGLSSYLHMVEAGEELIVTSHHRPVARVVPERRGLEILLPSKGAAVLRRLKGVALDEGRTAVLTLLDDRARR